MNWTQLLCTERPRPSNRPHDETRAEIVRDYGRVAFSTPVRRLQDKAQVFPLEPIDAVRTRLTHSMEVSSVARDLAHAVAGRLAKSKVISLDDAYAIESIAATVGLIHDIGNPPFGHSGEDAIQRWFQKREESVFAPFPIEMRERLGGDFLNFEGNAQTLRLLAKLQILSDRHGLNLTYATLSAACKYTASSLEIQKQGRHSKSKLGYFTSEQVLVDRIREKTGTCGARNPITMLVEAADDIVYSVVDIEDGVKKGLLSWGDRTVDESGRPTWPDHVKQSGVVRAILDTHERDIGAELLDRTAGEAERRIGSAEDGVKPKGRSRDEAIVQYFRTLAIGAAVAAVADLFMERYDEIMAGEYDHELLYESKVAGLYHTLKKRVGRTYVYPAKSNLRLELLGRGVIHDLLDLFHEADPEAKPGTFPGKAYHLLSQNYRTVFENPGVDEKGLPKEYRRLLLITDYICGMTDTFALNLHRELFNG